MKNIKNVVFYVFSVLCSTMALCAYFTPIISDYNFFGLFAELSKSSRYYPDTTFAKIGLLCSIIFAITSLIASVISWGRTHISLVSAIFSFLSIFTMIFGLSDLSPRLSKAGAGVYILVICSVLTIIFSIASLFIADSKAKKANNQSAYTPKNYPSKAPESTRHSNDDIYNF